MKRVPSSEFRVTFAREAEPVAVTVLGRVIGYWVPGGILETELGGESFIRLPRPAAGVVEPPSPSVPEPVAAGAPKGRAQASDGSAAGMTQADRDKVLAKVAGRR